jgi:hypothetical protein
MEGVNHNEELKGIIPRAFAQIFDTIATKSSESTEFLVRASYLELYNEEVRDLLSKNASNRLELKVRDTPNRTAVAPPKRRRRSRLPARGCVCRFVACADVAACWPRPAGEPRHWRLCSGPHFVRPPVSTAHVPPMEMI